MPDKMLNVSSGIQKSELHKVTATVEDVKTGKTFMDYNGIIQTGTLDPNPTMHITDTITDFVHSTFEPYLKAVSNYTCGNKSYASENYLSHHPYLDATRKCSALFNCRYSGGFQIYANTNIYASVNGSGYSFRSSGSHLITISDTGTGRVEAYIDI